jgi:pantoate--beta-alanine ligase
VSIPVVTSVVTTLAAIRDALAPNRNRSIGFVPTMGALHAGHRSLIEQARAQSGYVVVSIFVNPLQFDQPQDYQRYARTLPADVALCAAAGADLVFAPTASEMYPRGSSETSVDLSGVSEHFCGASRPGHFRGVATVVAKLFNIVQPDLAFFGEKDAQQLAVIERMALDLNFPVTIVPAATVRELDGLAMSSRNARLNPSERVTATCLHRALLAAQSRIGSGERDCARIVEDSRALLAQPGVRVDYFDLADPAAMLPVNTITGPVRIMGAIWVGDTRLIDNLLCRPNFPSSPI